MKKKHHSCLLRANSCRLFSLSLFVFFFFVFIVVVVVVVVVALLLLVLFLFVFCFVAQTRVIELFSECSPRHTPSGCACIFPNLES